LVPDRTYNYLKAKDLIDTYYKTILKEIESIVSKHSRMYWIHLSRRVLPSTSGDNDSPQTIQITRRIIDGAIEKFGSKDFCESVGITGEIEIDQIFDGLLVRKEFEYEKTLIEELPSQVVLTKFNSSNYLEYYELEKLAYEVWKCGATLRAIGKGAKLTVDNDLKERFFDERSHDLSFLIKNYDSRPDGELISRKGVVLKDQKDIKAGQLFIPTYNTSNLKVHFFNKIFKEFEIPLKFGEETITNFIPTLYPLRGFYKNNEPLFSKFKKKYNVEVVSILTVITAVSYRLFHKFFIEKNASMVKPFFLRAYNGPIVKNEIIQELENFKELASLNLNLTEEEKKLINIEEGFDFLCLSNTQIIDLLFTAPLKLFIPVSSERYIIDYCKIPNILDDLMFGIKINDENFKGDLFENSLVNKKPILPTGLLKAQDETTKQVDYSIKYSDILIICECKLKEMSIGYYKGNLQSIETRRTNVINKAINEADEKARWLARRPIGKNYDISNFKYILPIGISAFKEFVHSKMNKYWINKNTPRILMPKELDNIINKKEIDLKSYNLIKVQKQNSK